MVIEEVRAGRRNFGVGPLFGLTPLGWSRGQQEDHQQRMLTCIQGKQFSNLH